MQNEAAMLDLKGFRRPLPGTQPNHLHPPYVSSVKRAPTKPLVSIPQTLSEITGPMFGSERVDVKAFDLTKQHPGEPLGERIVVSGRVIDEDGRPVRHTLVEVWQCNAAGRYQHKVDLHDAPLDPNFTGGGHTLTDSEGRWFVTNWPERISVKITTTPGDRRIFIFLCLARRLPPGWSRKCIFRAMH
jgi:protocatechuate 3,4-dioxygenase beta subunit